MLGMRSKCAHPTPLVFLMPESVSTVDADLDEDNIYDDYSGRGMFGDTCFGFTCVSEKEAIGFFVALAENEPELAKDLIRKLKTDSMGYGMIYYFPGYQLEG